MNVTKKLTEIRELKELQVVDRDIFKGLKNDFFKLTYNMFKGFQTKFPFDVEVNLRYPYNNEKEINIKYMLLDTDKDSDRKYLFAHNFEINIKGNKVSISAGGTGEIEILSNEEHYTIFEVIGKIARAVKEHGFLTKLSDSAIVLALLDIDTRISNRDKNIAIIKYEIQNYRYNELRTEASKMIIKGAPLKLFNLEDSLGSKYEITKITSKYVHFNDSMCIFNKTKKYKTNDLLQYYAYKKYSELYKKV